MTEDERTPSEEWNRYGSALIAVMRYALDEVDDQQHELLLETADFWLGLGLVIGLERRRDAQQLLTVLQGAGADPAEMLSDAEGLLYEAVR